MPCILVIVSSNRSHVKGFQPQSSDKARIEVRVIQENEISLSAMVIRFVRKLNGPGLGQLHDGSFCRSPSGNVAI